MNRLGICITICLATVGLAGVAQAKEKSLKAGPLSGTWECTSHGGSRGDMAFTLDLQQEKDTVAGSVTSPIGSADLSNASFKNKTLEIQIESDSGDYVLTAKLKDGKLSGEWTHGNENGTWEGKKQASEGK
jgi:hypothetical protein